MIYQWSPKTYAISVSATPTTCASVDPGGADIEWLNPQNALTSNDSQAAADISKDEITEDLRCSGFDLSSIPNGATILGITASVERSVSGSSNSRDYEARLMKNGEKVGSNLATNTTIPKSDTIINYGGSSNLWGTSWTSADIKQSGFGVSYAATHTSVAGRDVYVDAISVKVDYSYEEPIELSQGNYRIYTSSSEATPGAALGAINQKVTVPSAPSSGFQLASIAAGVQQTCGLTANGTAYCWGFNGDGQLGDGTTTSRWTPTAVSTSVKFSYIYPAFYHTCGLAVDGTAYCWGFNGNGRLGDGTTTSRSLPTPVDTALKFASLVAGASHTCGLTAAGKAYCWGFNGNGQLGDSTAIDKSLPTAVDTTLAFTTLSTSVGNSHTCGLIADGTAYCWGYNYSGQLGDGTDTTRFIPTAVLTSLKFSSISAAGSYHTCALTPDGTAYCWGFNGNGQMGNNDYESTVIPYAVDTSIKFSFLSGGGGHTCGLIADGTAYCWGFNATGQVGDNTIVNKFTPVTVVTSLKFSSISPAGGQTCALTINTIAYCWGRNPDGLLGDGTDTQRNTPTAVYTAPDSAIMDNSFRLRLALTLETSSILTIGSEEFRLEYAVRTQSTCEAQTTGFAVVTSNTPIAWHAATPPADRATVVANTSTDPVTTNTTYQNIIRSSDTIVNRTTVSTNQHLLWDFALKNISESPGTSYCLRMAKSDGSLLAAGYDHVPEITTTLSTEPPSVTFRSSANQVIASPNFVMPSLNVLASCQTSSFTLGATDGVKLRLQQGANATSGFSIAIAPSDGQSALWSSSSGGHYYDFNDPAGIPAGCSNGSDGDLYGGQLTINRSASTLTPSLGCGLTGLSYSFSSSAFASGTNDSITLVQGSSSVATNCYWDLQDTGFSQTVPPAQPAGNYSLDLTITVVAS